jgi:hypothetical protein
MIDSAATWMRRVPALPSLAGMGIIGCGGHGEPRNTKFSSDDAVPVSALLQLRGVDVWRKTLGAVSGHSR